MFRCLLSSASVYASGNARPLAVGATWAASAFRKTIATIKTT